MIAYRALALLLIVLPVPVAAQSPQWMRYNLNQASASVDLPVDIFAVDAGPTREGTGRTFSTPDGRADVTLYVIPNQPRRSPSAFLRDTFQLPQSSAVYRRVTRNMLAVSGFRGDKIWYARCNFGAVNMNCVALNYPAREKLQWDGAVTRISHSLSRAG